MTDLPTRQEVETHARETVERMTDWACKEFGFASFAPMDLYITFQNNYYRSKGGRGFRDGKQHAVISLHLYQFTTLKTRGHYEYAAYADDLEIGSFIHPDWKINLEALVAHEVSHAIQHLLPYWPSRYQVVGKSARYGDLGSWEANHGEFFQAIYRKLRKHFINPRLEYYQLGCPGLSFELELLPSDATGERIVGSNNRPYEVLGRRARARIQVYWIRDLRSNELATVSAQELYDWWPTILPSLHVDGYSVVTKMAA